MNLDVERNEVTKRFESEIEGHLCVLDYRIHDKVISMNRVYVPPPLEGRGIAGEMTRHALDWAAEQHLQVRPICPYIASWIKRNPDYQRLLYENA